ncbi:unnamed protein product [Prorocentrum cordatum]|uniref:Uncharacterized protein n=1 Tax=Prorocentrum cordatum TaxID=2364126 RepID=A0ABN9XQ90_9DINO|nr:unnamed protein product [Polarella glacialis]
MHRCLLRRRADMDQRSMDLARGRLIHGSGEVPSSKGGRCRLAQRRKSRISHGSGTRRQSTPPQSICAIACLLQMRGTRKQHAPRGRARPGGRARRGRGAPFGAGASLTVSARAGAAAARLAPGMDRPPFGKSGAAKRGVSKRGGCKS